MATYNGGKHLNEQLNSFLLQTRLPDELIVCDDGSTDNTLDILESFRTKATFRVLIFLNEKNIGFTKNFEQVLSKCSGDLILLSDQDDVWFENKIYDLEQVFLSDISKLLVISDGNLVDENLNWFGVTALQQVQSGYGSSDALIVGALTAMRKEFLLCALPLPDGYIGHDVWLHDLARKLDTRIVLNKSLQLIRRHSSNTSNWVASSVNKINKFDVFKSQFRTVLSNDYKDRININLSTIDRLLQISNSKNTFSKEIIEASIAYLILERRALDSRNRIPQLNFFKRKYYALLMLFTNQYRFFNGYKSFFRDIIR